MNSPKKAGETEVSGEKYSEKSKLKWVICFNFYISYAIS